MRMRKFRLMQKRKLFVDSEKKKFFFLRSFNIFCFGWQRQHYIALCIVRVEGGESSAL